VCRFIDVLRGHPTPPHSAHSRIGPFRRRKMMVRYVERRQDRSQRQSRKHTSLPVFQTIQTLRFVLFHRAGAV
jgi:hypothetical protein